MSANGKGFLKGLGWWMALAIPSTYTNSMVGPFCLKLSLTKDSVFGTETCFGVSDEFDSLYP